MVEEANLDELEVQYKKMLASRIAAMNKSLDDVKETSKEDKAQPIDFSSFEKKYGLKPVDPVEEENKRIQSLFDQKVKNEGWVKPTSGEGANMGNTGIDNRDNDNLGHKFSCSTLKAINTDDKIIKEAKFLKKFAASRGHKRFSSYEDLASEYAANGVIAFTDSDLGCNDNVSAWEVADCFADVIWQDVICKSNFAGRITVRGLDFNAGCGGKVQLRTINVATASSDFGAMSPCTCLSCVSNTFSTYTLTMEVYGDYKVLCDLDLFTAGDVVKSAVIKSMSARAAERVDYKIYSVLAAASPTYHEHLTGACGGTRGTDGVCCTYTMDIYNQIVDLEAAMRAAGYFDEADPILILSPTVARYLKYKDGLQMPSYIASQIKMDGLKLAAIGNISVIESCHANACTATGSAVQAILIDPSRAIGEAWGKRPTFKIDDDPIECGSQKIVLRMWADFAILDTGAVGHILNP